MDAGRYRSLEPDEGPGDVLPGVSYRKRWPVIIGTDHYPYLTGEHQHGNAVAGPEGRAGLQEALIRTEIWFNYEAAAGLILHLEGPDAVIVFCCLGTVEEANVSAAGGEACPRRREVIPRYYPAAQIQWIPHVSSLN